MSEATTESRLQELEWSNKRLKIGLSSLLVLLFAGVLLGAALPQQKIVTAEQFILIDAQGRHRGQLSSNAKSSALQFVNADGSRALIVAAGQEGNGIFVNNVNGETRLSLYASLDDSAMLGLQRAKETGARIALRDSTDGSVLFVRDGNHVNRLLAGFSGTGASISLLDANDIVRSAITPEMLATWDPAGQLKWASLTTDMSPQERKQLLEFINRINLKP